MLTLGYLAILVSTHPPMMPASCFTGLRDPCLLSQHGLLWDEEMKLSGSWSIKNLVGYLSTWFDSRKSHKQTPSHKPSQLRPSTPEKQVNSGTLIDNSSGVPVLQSTILAGHRSLHGLMTLLRASEFLRHVI